MPDILPQQPPMPAPDAPGGAGVPGWRQWSAPERERQVSPSSCIGGDYRPFIQAYAERSRQARAQALAAGGRWLEWRTGPGAAQRLDLCLPPGAGAARPVPLLVFVHGGYWQELSAQDSCFTAADCIAAGVAFAALDYTLAPSASVSAIVDECRAALAMLGAQGPAVGIDAARIVVAGSSAGGQLAAMMCLPAIGGAPAEGTRAAVRPMAAVLVSPVTELEPLIGSSVNDALALDVPTARRLSPVHQVLSGFPPAVVCWGSHETHWFQSMGRDLVHRLQAVGTPCEGFEVPGRNHFDVVLDLMDPATRLGRATRALWAPPDAGCGSDTPPG